jgi:hypothetical protein
MDIAANLARIRAAIAAACARCGRDPTSVHLVAVSKTHPAARVEEAYTAGQTCFGESYVQEFLAKAELVKVPVTWHFIGHLQSNKVRGLPGRVALIHSVDRLSLAEEIDHQWGKVGARAEVLIEVNLGGETSKAGVAEADVLPLLQRLALLPHLSIRGLMTLPPYLDDPEEVRHYFRRLRELATQLDALALPGVSMAELSMGMSDDFTVAIEEGATLVRIGTAIFGARAAR